LEYGSEHRNAMSEHGTGTGMRVGMRMRIGAGMRVGTGTRIGTGTGTKL